jgi:hypothetical protein
MNPCRDFYMSYLNVSYRFAVEANPSWRPPCRYVSLEVGLKYLRLKCFVIGKVCFLWFGHLFLISFPLIDARQFLVKYRCISSSTDACRGDLGSAFRGGALQGLDSSESS